MNLRNLIYPELIFPNIKAADCNEALKRLTDTLLEKGFVKEGYYEMLMAREAVYPTGLRTEPFAATVPHADPDCVFKPCIVIARLEKPPLIINEAHCTSFLERFEKSVKEAVEEL